MAVMAVWLSGCQPERRVNVLRLPKQPPVVTFHYNVRPQVRLLGRPQGPLRPADPTGASGDEEVESEELEDDGTASRSDDAASGVDRSEDGTGDGEDGDDRAQDGGEDAAGGENGTEGVDLVAARRLFSKFTENLGFEEEARADLGAARCPPPSVEVEGVRRDVREMGDGVFVPLERPDLRILKWDQDMQPSFSMFALESAIFAETRGLSYLSLEAYEITGGVTATCKARLMATDYPGPVSLMALLEAEYVCSTGEIALMGARILSALAGLHSYGVVSLDVNAESIFSIQNDRPMDVKLGRFAAPEFFIDSATGRHLPCVQGAALAEGEVEDPSLLSPFELEGSCRHSRRNDVYRLAEVLLLAAAPEAAYAKILRPDMTLAEAKRGLTIEAGGEVTWQEFHQYSLSLELNEKPDYATWIARFSALATHD